MPVQTLQTLLLLDQVSLADRPSLGGKAAVLGTLRQAGLPVPPGFCIPWNAWSQDETALWQAIAAEYRRLSPAGEPVAVRSSGVAEDSATASYAGQFETILNVRTLAELKDAIQQCQASARSDRVAAYEAQQAQSGGELAVLVQRQVPVRLSGVSFTRDPRTGLAGSLWIEAVAGVGEALVGGRAAPISFRLDRQGNLQEGQAQGWLSPVELQRLAQLSARVEDLLGLGQDIEWAVDPQGEVWLLQARPVTPSAARLPLAQIWTRANVGEVLPDPVTPLTWAVFRSTLQKDLSRLWDPTDGADHEGVRRIEGRVYIRLDGFLNSFCYLPAVTPTVMQQVLGVELPPLAEPYSPPAGLPVRLAQVVFWLDAFGLLPRLAWLVDRVVPLPDSQPSALPALLSWTTDLFGLHLKATAYAIGAYAVLARWVSAWLPEQGPQLLPQALVGREDLQTAAQGRSLWKLAQSIRSNPARLDSLQTALARVPSPENLDVALQAAFGQARTDFMAKNGARAAGEFELATPRWREDPAFVLDVLRGYLAASDLHEAPQRRSAAQAAGTIAARLDPVRRWLFRRMLAAYTRYSTLRENLKYRLMEGYAGLRQIFLLQGQHLQAAGLLARREDIFYLTPFEIRQAQAGELQAPEIRAKVLQCRSQAAAWSAKPAQELRVGVDLAAQAGIPGRLQGIPASPGVVVGQARVLSSSLEAGQLLPGEILVAPHTDPGWTPLFLSCKAVVTEIGGFLSHGATIAREYGIPCVVNVPEATAQIKTGDTLRVDGTTGQIDLLN